jgi:hypothetical protein
MRVVLRVPLNKPIGKVTYTIESLIEPVTFNKKRDAEAFRKLLNKSVQGYKGVIVRREITDEGFEPTYGDRK